MARLNPDIEPNGLEIELKIRDTMHKLLIEATRGTEAASYQAKEARSRIIAFECEHANDSKIIKSIPKIEKLADIRVKLMGHD